MHNKLEMKIVSNDNLSFYILVLSFRNNPGADHVTVLLSNHVLFYQQFIDLGILNYS